MTTIFGVKVDKGKKENRGVILSSDSAGTKIELKSDSMGVYKQETKRGTQKIQVSKDKSFAFGMAGINDKLYVHFARDILKGKYDIEKAINNGKFPEFNELTQKRWDGKRPDLEKTNELIIASRFNNKPGLHRIYTLGDIEEVSCDFIGSGSTHVRDYFNVMEPSINLTMRQGIDLAHTCITHAGKDIYTVGFDIAIIKPDKIEHFLNPIQREYETAKKRIIKNIKQTVID